MEQSDALRNLGKRMNSKFSQYAKDRYELEQKLLRNRRQYRGEYDSDVLLKLDPNRSRVYPKLTRVKVIGMVSRLMDLLFPRTEKNWAITPTPFPDLSQEELQKLLSKMPPGQEITDEFIEKAIYALAETRCKRMEKTIVDQLEDSDMDYITLARKVIFSAVLYGYGVLKGPLVNEVKKRSWRKDPMTGQYIATTISALAPYYEFVPVWGFYPDLSAKTRAQMDGSFERHIMNRYDLLQLAERTDFNGDVIRKFISDYPTGNFKEESFEAEIRGEKNSIDMALAKGTNKYMLIEWWGNITPQEAMAYEGINLPEGAGSGLMTANVWTLGENIVKLALSPYPKEVNIHHMFVYEDDDSTVVGNGLPEVIRESQLSVCAAARMLLDNASITCGPILEANREVLAPGVSTAVHAYKVYEREGLGQEASIPAIREIRVDSHIMELKTIIEMFQGFADVEAALPAALMGDMSNTASEPFRTQGNTSQLMGAAALPIRDVVRNFDQFTESVIQSLYYWNMTFNPDTNIKGDYKVSAIGSTSLIAKEVRAYAMDNLKATMTPDEQLWLKEREFLEERLAVRDLPADKLLLTEEEHAKRVAQIQQSQQEEQDLARRSAEADIKKTTSSAILNIANAEAAEEGTQIEAYKQVIATLEALVNANNTGTDSVSNQQAAPVSERPSGAGLGVLAGMLPAPAYGEAGGM